MRILSLMLLTSTIITAQPIVKYDNGFSVIDEKGEHEVQPCFVDKQVRNLTKKQLDAFCRVGYLKPRKSTTGQYSIQSFVRGEGGGPILGSIVYWTVKGVGIGLPYVISGAVGGLIGRRLGRGQGPIDPHLNPEIGHIVSESPEISHVAGGAASTVAAAGGYYAFVEGVAVAAGTACGMTPTP